MGFKPRHTTLLLAAMATACADVVTGTHGDASAPAVDAAVASIDLCGVTPLVDASRVGEVRGRVTRVPFTEADLAHGAPMPPSEGCSPPRSTTHRLVVRYTMRADAYVNVAIGDVPWSSVPAVARVVMLDGCGPAAQRVACGGPGLLVDSVYVSVLAASPTRLRAGTVLTIAVALDRGAGVLDVTEVPEELPPDAACDPTLRTGACVFGASCANGRCLRDGIRGARCRSVGAPCDAGLRCERGARDGYAGRCTPTVPVGARCDDYAVCEGDTCARGEDGASYCVRDPGVQRAGFEPGARCTYTPEGDSGYPFTATGGCALGTRCALTRAGAARCMRPGSLDAPCENPRLRCDEGLACVGVAWNSEPVCVQLPSALATCNPNNSGAACGEGTTCLDRGDGLGICLHDGSPTAPCGFAGCDDPNVCIRDRCSAALSLGAPCEQPGACGPTADCVARVCVARGALGSTCRVRAPACDAGLACSDDYHCAPAAALGAPCGLNAACVDYARCDGTCRATGAAGGWCRLSAPACDAGLACVSNNGGPPVCLPRLALGDACGSRAGVCPPGAGCVVEGTTNRCAPLVAPMPCDHEGACGPRGRCDHRWCVPAPAVGEACAGSSLCADGAACVGNVCVSLGTLGHPCGAGASCDAGQRCAAWTDGLSQPACVAASPPGSACGLDPRQGCAPGAACIGNVCVVDGTLDAACRDGADPCDAGLVCYGGVCTRTVGAGELCGFARAPACVAGLVCRFVEPDTRCRAPLYDVSTREGVALEDPCNVPPGDLTAPLSVVIDGVTYGVEVTPAGQVALRRAGAATTSLFALFGGGAGPAYPRCVRVLGAAPSRRVVASDGPSGRGLHPSVADWEEVLYEGSNAIELRFGAALPSGRQWAWPMLATRIQRQVIGPVRVRAGTAVRLTPR